MFQLNGKFFDVGIAQVINGEHYPVGWFSNPNERSKMGIIEVLDPPIPDRKFNYVTRLESGYYEEVPKPLSVIKEMLKADVTAKRWEVENGGITLPDGRKILTAKADQDRVDTALNNMERYDIQYLDFKSGSGWVKVTYSDLKAMGAAMVIHVQKCFSAEAKKHFEIDNMQFIEQLKSYNIDSGWPS